jgi:hypothetical protein
METRIPFSGFYESSHDQMLDDALNSMVSDDQGRVPPEAEDLWQHVNWQQAQLAYVKLYVGAFEREFEQATGIKLALKFNAMTSPKEYNFTTDRIFADVSPEAVAAVYAAVDKAALDKAIHRECTSRDGFSSYYRNSLQAWLDDGEPDCWDHNQLCTLITTLWDQHSDEDALQAWNLLENAQCNGAFDTIVYEALTDEGREIVEKCAAIQRGESGGFEVENDDEI